MDLKSRRGRGFGFGSSQRSPGSPWGCSALGFQRVEPGSEGAQRLPADADGDLVPWDEMGGGDPIKAAEAKEKDYVMYRALPKTPIEGGLWVRPWSYRV